MDWTDAWTTVHPPSHLAKTLHMGDTLRDMHGFLSAAPGAIGQEFTYDTSTAINDAKLYAARDWNIGAPTLRKLIKVTEMMMDPDMEDHLPSAMNGFCEHMWNVCAIVQAITDDALDALRGLRLIAAAKGLFTMGLMVRLINPVRWTGRAKVITQRPVSKIE